MHICIGSRKRQTAARVKREDVCMYACYMHTFVYECVHVCVHITACIRNVCENEIGIENRDTDTHRHTHTLTHSQGLCVYARVPVYFSMACRERGHTQEISKKCYTCVK